MELEMWLTQPKEPEIPEDVKYFISKIKEKGFKVPCKVALHVLGPKWEIVDMCLKKKEEVDYSKVIEEKDVIECDELTCVLILRDSIKLVFDKDTREVYESEEEVP